MDVNKIQALNEYAKTLKSHNIVASSEDAVRQAEKLYGGENNYSTERPRQMDDNNELRLEVRKLNAALASQQGQMSQVIKAMNEMITEINNLKKANNALRNEVEELKRRPVAAPPKKEEPKPEPVAKDDDRVSEAITGPQTSISAPSADRRGTMSLDKPVDRNNIAPSSVSVDKIFYFGNK